MSTVNLVPKFDGGLEDQFDVFTQIIKPESEGGLSLDQEKALETLEQLDSYGIDVDLSKTQKDKLFGPHCRGYFVEWT